MANIIGEIIGQIACNKAMNKIEGDGCLQMMALAFGVIMTPIVLISSCVEDREKAKAAVLATPAPIMATPTPVAEKSIKRIIAERAWAASKQKIRKALED